MAAVATTTPFLLWTTIHTSLRCRIEIAPLISLIHEYAFVDDETAMAISLLAQKTFQDLCPFLGIPTSVEGFFRLPRVREDLTAAFEVMQRNLGNATPNNLMRELSKAANRWEPSAEVVIASATETPSGGAVSCWLLESPMGIALTISSEPTERDVRLIVLFSPSDETFEVFPSLSTFDMHHTNDQDRFWYPRGDVEVTASTVASLMFQFLHRSIHGKDKSTLPMIQPQIEEAK